MENTQASATRPNIVYLDCKTVNRGDLSWEPLERLGNFKAYDRTEREHVVERAAEADIVIVNKTRLDRDLLAQLPRLRLVCVAATGYDVVDVRAAAELGIPVCNCGAYGTNAVAQMVVALLLEVTNCVGHYAEANRHGFWANSPDFSCMDTPLTELDGKRLAVVGFGNIGRAVTDLLRPFGMSLHAVTSKPQSALPPDVAKIELEEAFSACDVVSLNCPLTPENEGFVNEQLLKLAKPGLILINTARGKLVNDEAVADALRENRLGAYCADVLSQEPPQKDHVLLSTPRTFITPHIAWATVTTRQRLLNILRDNIDRYLNGHPQNVVNQ